MNYLNILGFESVPAGVKERSFYDLKAALPGSKGELDFATLKGKAVLIVNTASKCGFTPQYTGLEELHKTYAARGLEVLGFPSNEFGGQDPGSDEEIASFCQVNHGVTFPLMKKSEVNGAHMNDVFAWLKANGKEVDGAGGIGGTTSIKWNFTKFLVNREGHVVGRYSPNTTPEQLKVEIEKLL
ncbi:glutathione peroxidase [Dioszegia hungarica]|uniref:Glutathione peroxidase n=1 Tax=Dioszegia hungarica TaxID=4972 RepID=A0AA38H5H7_9TREE|nr:glutathione peroxidase [Dioszegia hungarica]KAI9632914.1 glutathione peroxidase [Dioszegia hungarica]